jgi:serine/threonine protein kinase
MFKFLDNIFCSIKNITKPKKFNDNTKAETKDENIDETKDEKNENIDEIKSDSNENIDEYPQVINLFYSHFHPSNIKHLHDAICIKCLGKGGFGEVKLYQCKEKDKLGKKSSCCNKCFVVKEIKAKKWSDEADKIKQLKVLMNEYTVGSLLHHKYIIETLDIDIVDKKIIFEYCPGIDFFELIDKNKEYHSEFKNEYLNYFKKIVDAVEYIHSQGVAHLDLKLENIVINEKTKTVKIIDFGGACVCKIDKKADTVTDTKEIKEEIVKIAGIRGTYQYIAPEVFMISRYDPFKVDIWALGIIFYEILYRVLPWKNATRNNKRYNDHYAFFNNTNQLIPYIFKLYPKFNDVDKQYVLFNTLLIKMLNPNPDSRSTIKDIKELLMNTS